MSKRLSARVPTTILLIEHADINDSIGADCWFISLDSDAPPRLAWMNGDDRQNAPAFDNIRERIISAENDIVAPLIEANSGSHWECFMVGLVGQTIITEQQNLVLVHAQLILWHDMH